MAVDNLVHVSLIEVSGPILTYQLMHNLTHSSVFTFLGGLCLRQSRGGIERDTTTHDFGLAAARGSHGSRHAPSTAARGELPASLTGPRGSNEK